MYAERKPVRTNALLEIDSLKKTKNKQKKNHLVPLSLSQLNNSQPGNSLSPQSATHTPYSDSQTD
jgi:hypothetical protein